MIPTRTIPDRQYRNKRYRAESPERTPRSAETHTRKRTGHTPDNGTRAMQQSQAPGFRKDDPPHGAGRRPRQRSCDSGAGTTPLASKSPQRSAIESSVAKSSSISSDVTSFSRVALESGSPLEVVGGDGASQSHPHIRLSPPTTWRGVRAQWPPVRAPRAGAGGFRCRGNDGFRPEYPRTAVGRTADHHAVHAVAVEHGAGPGARICVAVADDRYADARDRSSPLR